MGKREVLALIDCMEAKWDTMMLFDPEAYGGAGTIPTPTWDPTQQHGVHGKLPRKANKALLAQKTPRSDEFGFSSQYDLVMVENYLALNQASFQSLKLIPVSRRLFGR